RRGGAGIARVIAAAAAGRQCQRGREGQGAWPMLAHSVAPPGVRSPASSPAPHRASSRRLQETFKLRPGRPPAPGRRGLRPVLPAMIRAMPPGLPHHDDRVYRWRFGAVEFDEARHELRVSGLPVEVEHKPLQVLTLLLRHVGEVVTKEELFDTVWAGRVTVDHVLATAVGKLRKALDA